LKTAPARPEAKGRAPAPPAAPRSRSRPRDDSDRRDPDRAPPRRGKAGSVVLLLSILVILLLALGVAGIVVYSYVDDLQQRVAEGKTPPPPPAPPPPGMGGMLPGGMPPGGMPPGGMAFPAPGVVLKIGDLAPEIEGTDLDGKPMKLSEFRGQVVVIDFWGDWSPSKSPYPYLTHLVNRMKGEPFVLLGVNSDPTLDRAKQVAKGQKIGWRSWWDAGGMQLSGPLFQRYGVTMVPTTFVLDKKGIVRQRYTGPAVEILLDRAVDETLALGENRPADAPPRWHPGSTAHSQLADEVEVGPYRVRPPVGYTLEKPTTEAGRMTYRWKGQPHPDGGVPEFVVSLSPAQPPDKKLEAVLEKDLQAISPNSRLGFSCSAAERGDVKGLTFTRARWTLMEHPVKFKAVGLLYAAVDGDTLIRISSRDTMPTFNGPQDAAALSFRKAAK